MLEAMLSHWLLRLECMIRQPLVSQWKPGPNHHQQHQKLLWMILWSKYKQNKSPKTALVLHSTEQLECDILTRGLNMITLDCLLIQTQKCSEPAQQYNPGDFTGCQQRFWVFSGQGMIQNRMTLLLYWKVCRPGTASAQTSNSKRCSVTLPKVAAIWTAQTFYSYTYSNDFYVCNNDLERTGKN